MFAVLALIAFAIALVGWHLGPINLVTLGLALIAAHLAWGTFSGGSLPWRRRP